MGSSELGGLGSLAHRALLELEGHYRFIFNPIRYTSLGLAICEAMMIGLPIVGLATTEMVTAIDDGFSGYLDTNVKTLIGYMKRMLFAPQEARHLGQIAQRKALERFNIMRFAAEWDDVFQWKTGTSLQEEEMQPVLGD